tara:strand:+ start:26 stop:559 length:534 start_codon:yes stop_codon:yes gene_type:complete
MKKLIVYIMLMCSSTLAVEYGYFSRENSQAEWSNGGELTLNEGDLFVYLGSSYYSSGDNYADFYIDIPNLSRKDMRLWMFTKGNSSNPSLVYREDQKSIIGPCTIILKSSDQHTYIKYKIIRAAESAEPSDSKYTASLNADGTRLAIGEQQGTNTSTRVYEYDDITEAWEQLGDNVE